MYNCLANGDIFSDPRAEEQFIRAHLSFLLDDAAEKVHPIGYEKGVRNGSTSVSVDGFENWFSFDIGTPNVTAKTPKIHQENQTSGPFGMVLGPEKIHHVKLSDRVRLQNSNSHRPYPVVKTQIFKARTENRTVLLDKAKFKPIAKDFVQNRPGQLQQYFDEYQFCKFCFKKGEDPKIYSSHVAKGKSGTVICPSLRKSVCELCGATGDKAHTAKDCHLNLSRSFQKKNGYWK